MIALKMNAYITEREKERINGRLDTGHYNEIVKCEAKADDPRECDFIQEKWEKKKEEKYKNLMAIAFADLRWCREREDVLHLVREMRNTYTRFCKHRDTGTETTIGFSYNSLDEAWSDGEFSKSESCTSGKKILNAFKGSSVKIFELPTSELCKKVLQELKSQFSKCEEKF